MDKSRKGLGLLASQFLDKYYRYYKYEHWGYVGAVLASQRQEYQRFLETGQAGVFPGKVQQETINDSVYDQLNTLEPDEHWHLAQADHLQQLFQLLTHHRETLRNDSQVINKTYQQLSAIKDIVDPDNDKISHHQLESIYTYRPELLEQLHNRVGHRLVVEESQLDHHAAGQGLFIQIDHPLGQLPPGTLLGLLPGVYYQPQENYPEHLHQKQNYYSYQGYSLRYDDSVLDFTQRLPYPLLANSLVGSQQVLKNKQEAVQLVDPSWLSPYGLGHKINHPIPMGHPNVVLLDIQIPPHFFDLEYLRHLPSIPYSPLKTDDPQRVVGIFSCEVVSHGQELLVDYLSNGVMTPQLDEHAPEWLQPCAPLPAYFTKYQYECDYSLLVQAIEYLFMTDQHKLHRQTPAHHKGLFGKRIQ